MNEDQKPSREKSNTNGTVDTQSSELERLVKLEAKVNSHWVFHTPDEFNERYINQIKSGLNQSIIRTTLTAIIILFGAGAAFINSIIKQTFDEESKELAERLTSEYQIKSDKIRDDFEWRRFHDYGTDFIQLARLYSKTPMDSTLMKVEIHELLKNAEGFFQQALEHGTIHASTYWEMGQIRYTYPIEFGIEEEVDLVQAKKNFELAVLRYKESEVAKGWRAECYIKLAEVNLRLSNGAERSAPDMAHHKANACELLLKARNELARVSDQTQPNLKGNIQRVAQLESDNCE